MRRNTIQCRSQACSFWKWALPNIQSITKQYALTIALTYPVIYDLIPHLLQIFIQILLLTEASLATIGNITAPIFLLLIPHLFIFLHNTYHVLTYYISYVLFNRNITCQHNQRLSGKAASSWQLLQFQLSNMVRLPIKECFLCSNRCYTPVNILHSITARLGVSLLEIEVHVSLIIHWIHSVLEIFSLHFIVTYEHGIKVCPITLSLFSL